MGKNGDENRFKKKETYDRVQNGRALGIDRGEWRK